MSRANVATDVVRTKHRRHVMAYENASCHTRVHVCACVSERVCVCAHMCAGMCMNNEIAPFSGFLLSHHVHRSLITRNLNMIKHDY